MFICNSSIPKSGSELLQVLLHQNENIYASSTSPLLEFISAARSQTSCRESKSLPSGQLRKSFLSFCREGMKGYYASITDRPIVCDKSRGWIAYYRLLQDILEEPPKIICMVRDLRQVFSSFENTFRKQSHLAEGPENLSNFTCLLTPERVAHWQQSVPVGLALTRMREFQSQGLLSKVCVVRYEDLMSGPQEQLDRIYDYLGLPSYAHQFTGLTKEVREDHSVFGVYGNHEVQSELKEVKHCLLGARLENEIVDNNRGYFETFYPERI